jgi:hypothetical protein
METDTITMIVTSTIAVIALSFSFYQIHLTRKHNELSVKPHMFFYFSTSQVNGSLKLEIYLNNHGLGPAIILSHEILFNNKPKMIESILAELKTATPVNVNYSIANVNGSVIKAGEKTTLFSLTTDSISTKDAEIIKNHMNDMTVGIDYQCTYEKKQFVPYPPRESRFTINPIGTT